MIKAVVTTPAFKQRTFSDEAASGRAVAARARPGKRQGRRRGGDQPADGAHRDRRGARWPCPFLPSLLERAGRRRARRSRDRGSCGSGPITAGAGIRTSFRRARLLTQHGDGGCSGHTVNAGALAGSTAGQQADQRSRRCCRRRRPRLDRGVDEEAQRPSRPRPADLPGDTTPDFIWEITPAMTATASCFPTGDAVGAADHRSDPRQRRRTFYTPTDLAATKLKTMVINPGRQLSWGFANPSQGLSEHGAEHPGSFELPAAVQRALRAARSASAADAGAAASSGGGRGAHQLQLASAEQHAAVGGGQAAAGRAHRSCSRSCRRR